MQTSNDNSDNLEYFQTKNKIEESMKKIRANLLKISKSLQNIKQIPSKIASQVDSVENNSAKSFEQLENIRNTLYPTHSEWDRVLQELRTAIKSIDDEKIREKSQQIYQSIYLDFDKLEYLQEFIKSPDKLKNYIKEKKQIFQLYHL